MVIIKAKVSAWLRELTTHFAPALVPAWRALRWKGIYMCICAWPLRYAPFPVNVPGIGTLSNPTEFCNFLGNFCSGELRCAEVEALLAVQPSPVIVDIGVNVGTTVRHWLSLNAGARVVGIDMMQEAIDDTTKLLKKSKPDARWQPICGAVSDKPGQIQIAFDDPLAGTNSVTNQLGVTTRTIQADTLDHWIHAETIDEIALIKIDVEGHGGLVLAGAAESLRKAKFVALEIHSSSEFEEAAKVLFEAGWLPFSMTGRNTWWRKS